MREEASIWMRSVLSGVLVLVVGGVMFLFQDHNFATCTIFVRDITRPAHLASASIEEHRREMTVRYKDGDALSLEMFLLVSTDLFSFNDSIIQSSISTQPLFHARLSLDWRPYLDVTYRVSLAFPCMLRPGTTRV